MKASLVDRLVAAEALRDYVDTTTKELKIKMSDKKCHILEIENDNDNIMSVKRVIADLEDEHNELFLK